MADDGTIVVQQDNSNENEPSSSSAIEKPKYFFAPLKSKRKMSTSSSSAAAAAAAAVAMTADGKTEMRPDVLLVNNVMPSDGNRLATIRKPHNPLKYPSNTNAASIDPEVGFLFSFKLFFLLFVVFKILYSYKFSNRRPVNWTISCKIFMVYQKVSKLCKCSKRMQTHMKM